MSENEITKKIIGCAIEVHRNLGPGLLESAYEVCLLFELERAGLKYESQLRLPVEYKGIRLNAGYRMDLLVEDKVIVELKAVDYLVGIHTAQLLTYLRLKNRNLGLLINFNSERLVDGIQRVVHNFQR